jgi:hypothetical protein
MSVDGSIALAFQFLGQFLELSLIFAASLFQRQRPLFDLVVLVAMQVLEVVLQTLASILGIFQLGCVILKLTVRCVAKSMIPSPPEPLVPFEA